MKWALLCATLFISCSGFSQTENPALNFELPKALLVDRCARCHGQFAEVPKIKFLRNTAVFFDLKNNGRNQKVPPRMAGVRLTTDEAILLRAWISQGAPDLNGAPTLTSEQVESVLR